jgi:CRP/FNR family nitrogen fixation transcriptional regulator
MTAFTQTGAQAFNARTSRALPTRWLRVGEAIALPASALRLTRNEEIYGEGDTADYVYQVVSGAVRTARFLDDGRRQIGAFLLPGGVFGLEPGSTHRFTAEAISETEILMVKRATLDKALSGNAEALRQLWALTAADLQQLQDQLLLLGRKSAQERVAAFLLEMSKRAQKAQSVHLPMSRNDIADYLGLTIETVSRTLSQLERRQIIRLSGSREIALCDRAALVALDA